MSTIMDEDKQRLNDYSRDWAQAKNDKVNDIQNNGSVSMWTYLKDAPQDVINFGKLQTVEPSLTGQYQQGQIPHDELREKAFQEAKDQAQQIYNYNQTHPHQPGQVDYNQPTLPSKWQGMLDTGKVR